MVDQTLQDELIRMAHSSHNNEDHVFDIDLEFEEVDKAVVHLSNGKTAGPDGMTGEHLKYGVEFTEDMDHPDFQCHPALRVCSFILQNC